LSEPESTKLIGCERLKVGLGIVVGHIPDFRIKVKIVENEGRFLCKLLTWVFVGIIILGVVANTLEFGTIKELFQNYFYGKEL
jgi:hypothetical protein